MDKKRILKEDIIQDSTFVNSKYVKEHSGKPDMYVRHQELEGNTLKWIDETGALYTWTPETGLKIVTWGDVQDKPEFAAVALSGSYKDLLDQPKIPEVDVNKEYVDTQDKALSDRIDNIASRGRYLSVWDCTTGLPLTEPESKPYEYKTGDYYLIGKINTSGGFNLKPEGKVYNGTPSTTADQTSGISVNDTYIFDGEEWSLIKGEGKIFTFAAIAGNPGDNIALSQELTRIEREIITEIYNRQEADKKKQNKLVAGDNITIDDSDPENPIISATGGSSGDKYLKDVKLDKELKTYYNIGKVAATPKSPVTLGVVGDTLETVFNNIFNVDVIQPTIGSNPKITLSFSTSADSEYGTSIGSVTATVNGTDGYYTCAGQTQQAQVTFSNYNITGAQGSLSSRTGTLTFATPYIVGISSAYSFTASAHHSDGVVATDNTGAPSDPIVQIKANDVTSSATSFSKSATTYPYYKSGTSKPTSGTRGSTSLSTSSGQNISYTQNNYLYILIAKGTESSQPSKTIQVYNDLTGWADFLGGTVNEGSVSFTQQNSYVRDYWCYRTSSVSQSSSSALIRLN